MKTIHVRFMTSSKSIELSVENSPASATSVKRLALSRWLNDSSCQLRLHESLCKEVYLSCNGHILHDTDLVQASQYVNLHFRLCGGKGGFGSMLRAIGAQIEKTTNREACRDLSGRRLRDINEEMRLKKWIAKQAEREQEKETRKKERLERRLATPKHTFTDSNYDKKRSEIPERINEALAQGLALQPSGSKRLGSELKGSAKKSKPWLQMDEELAISSSDTCSSDEEEPNPGGSSTSSGEESVGDQTVHTVLSTAKDLEGPGLPKRLDATEPSTSKDSTCDVVVSVESVSPACKDFAPISSSCVESLPSISNECTVHDDLVARVEPDTSAVSESEPNADVPISVQSCSPDLPLVVDLNNFQSAADLESTLNLDQLKAALLVRGMKCGGTLTERAVRLFSVKGLTTNQIDRSLLAKPQKKKT